MAPAIERIDSGCASNLMRVLISLTAPLDPHNGLALAPHIDQLFDQGYITFDVSGALVLSDECPPMIPMQRVQVQEQLGISKASFYRCLSG